MRTGLGRLLAPNLVERHLDPLRFAIGVSTIQAMKPRYGQDLDLWDLEAKVYSQWGEDGIIEFICTQLGLSRPRAIELGCGDFRECNTRFLAEYRNASVMAVDARDDMVGSVTGLPLYWQTTLIPKKTWITPASAPQLVAEATMAFGGLDILSLDIDGNDYWVMEAVDLTGIQVIVVEYNSAIGGELPVTVPRNDRFDRTEAHYSWLYYGASLRAWIHLLGGRGFTFVGSNRPCINAFFVRDDRATALGVRVPDQRHLDPYLDCRVRESRGRDGQLDFKGPGDWVGLIGDLPLVDVERAKSVTVRDASTRR